MKKLSTLLIVLFTFNLVAQNSKSGSELLFNNIFKEKYTFSINPDSIEQNKKKQVFEKFDNGKSLVVFGDTIWKETTNKYDSLYAIFLSDINIWYSLNNYSKKRKLSGFRIHKDNDFLANQNQDAEYSGGLELQLMTDYLNFYLFDLPSFKQKWSSYQSLDMGFKAFTPDELNIQDTSQLSEQDV